MPVIVSMVLKQTVWTPNAISHEIGAVKCNENRFWMNFQPDQPRKPINHSSPTCWHHECHGHGMPRAGGFYRSWNLHRRYSILGQNIGLNQFLPRYAAQVQSESTLTNGCSTDARRAALTIWARYPISWAWSSATRIAPSRTPCDHGRDTSSTRNSSLTIV